MPCNQNRERLLYLYKLPWSKAFNTKLLQQVSAFCRVHPACCTSQLDVETLPNTTRLTAGEYLPFLQTWQQFEAFKRRAGEQMTRRNFALFQSSNCGCRRVFIVGLTFAALTIMRQTLSVITLVVMGILGCYVSSHQQKHLSASASLNHKKLRNKIKKRQLQKLVRQSEVRQNSSVLSCHRLAGVGCCCVMMRRRWWRVLMG